MGRRTGAAHLPVKSAQVVTGLFARLGMPRMEQIVEICAAQINPTEVGSLHDVRHRDGCYDFRTYSELLMSTRDAYAIVLDDHPLVGRGMAQYLQSLRPE